MILSKARRLEEMSKLLCLAEVERTESSYSEPANETSEESEEERREDYY